MRFVTIGLALGVMAALLVLGGLPAVMLVGVVLLGGMILRWPLVGLGLTIIASILWIVGAIGPYAGTSLGLTELSLALTAASWGLLMLRCRGPITVAPHMLPLVLYATVVALGPLVAPAALRDSLTGIFKHIMLFMPYFLVANLAVTWPAVVGVCAVVSGTMTTAAIVGIGEFFAPGLFSADLLPGLGGMVDDSLDSIALRRVTGGLGDANWFGYSLAMAIPLALFWLRTNRSLLMRCVAFGMVGLQLAALVLTFTRLALLGFVVGALYLVVKRRLPLVPVAMLAILVVSLAPVWMPAGFAERMFSLQYLKEGSTPMRQELLSTGVTLLQERPLFGYGYQEFGREFVRRTQSDLGLELARRSEEGGEPAENIRVHNLYLDVAVQFGVVALLMFVAFGGLLLKELREIMRHGTSAESELAIALTASLLAFYVSGLGGHGLELKLFWVLAGMTAALRRVTLGRVQPIVEPTRPLIMPEVGR
jgi:O-antigen ligase